MKHSGRLDEAAGLEASNKGACHYMQQQMLNLLVLVIRQLLSKTHGTDEKKAGSNSQH